MTKPGEHKTVQARILTYAEAIGWTLVSREEAEQRRGFDPDVPPKDRAKGRSLFFDDLLDARVREFNPRYAEAEGALRGKFRHLHTDIYGIRADRPLCTSTRWGGLCFDGFPLREVWHQKDCRNRNSRQNNECAANRAAYLSHKSVLRHKLTLLTV
jgi:hypothetical protein